LVAIIDHHPAELGHLGRHEIQRSVPGDKPAPRRGQGARSASSCGPFGRPKLHERGQLPRARSSGIFLAPALRWLSPPFSSVLKMPFGAARLPPPRTPTCPRAPFRCPGGRVSGLSRASAPRRSRQPHNRGTAPRTLISIPVVDDGVDDKIRAVRVPRTGVVGGL
jgi:hypothetical protein